MSKTKSCCLCGLPYERMGNNPHPLAMVGRCCDACDEVVILARLGELKMADIERVRDAMARKLAELGGDLRLARPRAAGRQEAAAGEAPMTDHQPNYLSATLELTESVIPETTKLCLTPEFDKPVMTVEIDQGEGPEEDHALVILNRRQIECLVDFLSAWLARQNPAPKIPLREAPASP